MKKAALVKGTCPFLGMVDDAETSLGFSSNSNYCHRSSPIATPRFRHQEEFCLGGQYGKCPLFTSQRPIPLPEDMRNPRRSSEIAKTDSRKKGLVTLLAIFPLVLMLFILNARREGAPAMMGGAEFTLSPSPSNTPTHVAFPVIDTISDVPISTSTLKTTETSIPSATSTLPRNQLDIPIGTEHIFVIHRVVTGETLAQIADRYETNTEAILAVNRSIKNPGWSGTFLVVPFGFSDVGKLPSFVVYRVEERDRGISVEKLAKYLRVSPLDLKYYNGWTNDGDRPLVGDYLLVPRTTSLP